MKINIKLIGSVVLVILGLLFFKEKNTQNEKIVEENNKSDTNLNVKPLSKARVSKEPIVVKKEILALKTEKFKAQNEAEESAELISILFNKYSTSQNSNSEELIDDLKAIEFEPIRAVNESDVSSDFTVVRTKNTLPGVRYFHAQFFTDSDGREYLQHMSFEMGKNEPFERVVELAKAYLGAKVISEVKKPGYQLWKMDNGKNVYVKTMKQDDLKYHPHNAYSESDVGVQRIVIEEEIH